MRTLPIVAVQGRPVAWDMGKSLRKLEKQVRHLAQLHPATRLFIYPEYYLSGIDPNAAPPEDLRFDLISETIPGPVTERLGAFAAELGIWLLPGSFYERGDDGRIYNTAVVLSPDGQIAARYRKCFPWRPWETVAAGKEFVVFDIDEVGRVGLMICYDGWFPEVARQLAWLGAEVILQPTATYGSDRAQELVLARANAIVNQVYVVNVNLASPEGLGQSIIVDPEGHVLQVAGSADQSLVEVIDFDAVTRVRTYGTVGMSRVWEQLDVEGPALALPAYGGAIRPRRLATEVASAL
jgi:formamidase